MVTELANAAAKPEGYQRFLLEAVAGQVCLQGLALSQLDPKDAAVNALLSDAASLLLQVGPSPPSQCPWRAFGLECAGGICAFAVSLDFTPGHIFSIDEALPFSARVRYSSRFMLAAASVLQRRHGEVCLAGHVEHIGCISSSCSHAREMLL